MEIQQILSAIQGHSVVGRIEFVFDAEAWAYAMTLEVARDELLARSIRIVFEGVVDLELRGFGGGLNQLPLLAIEDISALGRERINYSVYEAEHGRFSLRCRRIRLESV